jgi:hypothetical protein
VQYLIYLESGLAGFQVFEALASHSSLYFFDPAWFFQVFGSYGKYFVEKDFSPPADLTEPISYVVGRLSVY